MRPVADIVRKLANIARALVPAAQNPLHPPKIIFNPQQKENFPSVQFDLDEDFVYPERVESEIFQILDKAVGGMPSVGGGLLGTDAIAWYVSFHHDGGPWGIFIPVSSLAYLENRLFGELTLSRAEKWQLAFQLLYSHEYMHFYIDYTVAQWELLLNAPCWASLHDRLVRSFESYLQIEESLANAHMLRSCRVILPDECSQRLDDFVLSQPPGYRDSLGAVGDEAFSNLFAETIQTYTGLFAVERGVDWSHESMLAFQAIQSQLYSQCPLYIVPDESRVGLPPNSCRLFTCIAESELSETASFKKDLSRLAPSLQKAWIKRKKQMAFAIPRFPDFEKIKGQKDVFSVRLNDNFRVHLRFKAPEQWEAFAAGSHKAMGHG